MGLRRRGPAGQHLPEVAEGPAVLQAAASACTTSTIGTGRSRTTTCSARTSRIPCSPRQPTTTGIADNCSAVVRFKLWDERTTRYGDVRAGASQRRPSARKASPLGAEA